MHATRRTENKKLRVRNLLNCLPVGNWTVKNSQSTQVATSTQQLLGKIWRWLMKFHYDLQSVFVWYLFSVLYDAVSHPETLWRTTEVMTGCASNGRGPCWFFGDAELVFVENICLSL